MKGLPNFHLVTTESLVIRGKSGTYRTVHAEHQASRWL